ncbi:MAG: polysaccharide biosynthesis tyrosine autokinase [Polyangiaceae bacterium]|nr:polysaccharide biosynthesis tyrosine autokinase [Polyangiaceae bacterium]
MNATSPVKPVDDSVHREHLIDLLALWRPIRKHWVTALAVAALCTVAAALWTMKQKRIFEASAVVQFDPTPPKPLGGKVESMSELGSGAVWDTREYYETQYQILQSRRVALGVVRELGLERDHAFLLNLPKGVEAPNLDPWTEEDAADALRGRISVEPIKQSRLATVRFHDANPERAARLLNVLVKTYREQNVDTMLEATDEAAQWLRSEHDKLYQELEGTEHNLHNYKVQNNLLSVEFNDQSNMLQREIAQHNLTLAMLREKKEQVSARRTQLAKIGANNPGVLPATELLSSAFLQGLRERYVGHVQERDGLSKAGLGSNHPDMLAAVSRLETARVALLGEVKNIQGALDRDLAAVQQEEGGVSALFEQAKKQALDLNLKEIEYNRLRRTKENTEKLYSLLLERSKETDLTRRLRVNNVTIVDEAMEPSAPIKPNVPLNVAAGLALGLLLGAGAALGRGLLDRTVKTPEDVEQTLGATFLGLIPEFDQTNLGPQRARKRQLTEQPELIVHRAPMSGIAEASRSVRTNLMFMAPDQPFRRLLITSAGPAEGKTTVACCIAITMAQAGRRVLLIDCDLRRPRVHRIFRARGTSAGPGLTSALLEETNEDPVLETEVPNLFVIPAGPIPPNPSEILQSERFRAFLTKMQGRFDQIILDSPPVVAVTDAVILSTIVDGTVIVVRAFKTSKDLARHGVRQLRSVGSTVAGIVLNAVNLNRDEYQYSYQYYRRGSYYSTPQTPSGSTDGGGDDHGVSPPPLS